MLVLALVIALDDELVLVFVFLLDFVLALVLVEATRFGPMVGLAPIRGI